MIATVDIRNGTRLRDYAGHAHLAPAVRELRAAARGVARTLQGRKVWMVNSTASGGGVAEMLPRLVGLLRELGVVTEWVTAAPQSRGFFPLTKRIHNLIHGCGRPGFSPEDLRLYERASRDMARALSGRVAPQDILIVHDPQPLAAGAMLKRRTGVTAVWRCHIGLDRRTRATDSAWRFLQPWVARYDHSVFSLPEYVPGFLNGNTSIISPAIDPLGTKNRDLSGPELASVLLRAGLMRNGHYPETAPAWRRRALRLQPDGTFAGAESAPDPGLLFRPVVAQISRWDRLKGWEPLLAGFLRLKKRHRRNGGRPTLHQRRVEALRLLLVGPDPAAVRDDPEGAEVLAELCAAYRGLPPEAQGDVALLALPMDSREQNHLMVNAIQRCATLVVQNSLQEGFGLTATEAMWKKVPVLGTSACGLRRQIRPGVDGLLTSDPQDAGLVAQNLDSMLACPGALKRWGLNAQRQVHERFLVFGQVLKWLQCLEKVAGRPPA